MLLKTGSIIKTLRTDNKMTQEQLANTLGVTPQAISRWESGSGYPDIEILPAIADLFSVSIDELIGYKKSEREERLKKIKEEMAVLQESGEATERIEFVRKALVQFPSDDDLREELAYALYFRWQETGEEALSSEAILLARALLDSSRNEEIHHSAILLLVSIYSEMGESEKALETTELLTPMKYCREFVKSGGIGDGNTEYYIQDEIGRLTDCLGSAIRNLVLNRDLPNDPSTWDKKLQMLETANALYKLIYGDNLLYHHERLAYNDWLMSTYLAAKGDTEELREATLAALESMCEHAIAHDVASANDRGKPFTSILTDKLVYPVPSKEFHETPHSCCYYRLENLQSDRYDSIRETARFKQMEEKLRAYAK